MRYVFLIGTMLLVVRPAFAKGIFEPDLLVETLGTYSHNSSDTKDTYNTIFGVGARLGWEGQGGLWSFGAEYFKTFPGTYTTSLGSVPSNRESEYWYGVFVAYRLGRVRLLAGYIIQTEQDYGSNANAGLTGDSEETDTGRGLKAGVLVDTAKDVIMGLEGYQIDYSWRHWAGASPSTDTTGGGHKQALLLTIGYHFGGGK